MLMFTSELKGFLHLQNVLHQKYQRVVFAAFYFCRIFHVFPKSPGRATGNYWCLEQQRQVSCDSAAVGNTPEMAPDRRLTARFYCIQLVLSRRPQRLSVFR